MKSIFSSKEQFIIADQMERGIEKQDAIQNVINTEAAFLHAKEKGGDSALYRLHGKRINEMIRGVPYEERSLE